MGLFQGIEAKGIYWASLYFEFDVHLKIDIAGCQLKYGCFDLWTCRLGFEFSCCTFLDRTLHPWSAIYLQEALILDLWCRASRLTPVEISTQMYLPDSKIEETKTAMSDLDLKVNEFYLCFTLLRILHMHVLFNHILDQCCLHRSNRKKWGFCVPFEFNGLEPLLKHLHMHHFNCILRSFIDLFYFAKVHLFSSTYINFGVSSSFRNWYCGMVRRPFIRENAKCLA